MERFVRRATRLYEQGPGEVFASSRFGRSVPTVGQVSSGPGFGPWYGPVTRASPRKTVSFVARPQQEIPDARPLRKN